MTAIELDQPKAAAHLISGLATMMTLAVAVLTVARLNAADFYLGEIVSFFLPTLALVALAATGLAIVSGRSWLMVVAFALLAINVYPLLSPVAKPASTASGPSLRIATSNVLSNRPDYQPLIDWSTRSGIDFLGQQEANRWTLRRLAPLAGHFPETLPDDLLGSNPDTVAWTGWRVLDARRVKPGIDLPMWGWGGKPLRLALAPPGSTSDTPALIAYVLHPTTPRSPEQWQARNAYLDNIAENIAAEPKDTPLVVIGDFNTPPWSPVYRRFLDKTGLIDAAGSPWPTTTRFSLRFRDWFHYGAPVDHILVSPGVAVTHFEVGPDIGSDHLPLIADIRLP